jgi:hypothetical protein
MAISIVQFGTYFLIDKYKLEIPTIIIFAIILLGHFFVFPQFFMPAPKTNNDTCGMPVLGVFLGFWIFGTITGLITHLVWMIKLQKKYKKTLFDKG